MQLSYRGTRESLEEIQFLKEDLDGLKSYKLKPGFSMYDMCYCAAKCATPCGRRQVPIGVHTISDFSQVCSDYEEEK